MLPVVNTPLLDRLIEKLEASGVDDILLAVNYLAAELHEYARGRAGVGRSKISISTEPEPLGSGGALKYNEGFLNEAFLLLNGDIVSDLDYSEMLDFHRRNAATVTVNVAWVEDPTRFGVIDCDEDGRVRTWQEKPTREEARSNWVNVGAWIVEPSILEHIPTGKFVSLEREVFPQLLQASTPFYAFKSTGYWLDIGTPASYVQVHRDILSRTIDEPIPGAPRDSGAWVMEECDIDASAQVQAPVAIGKGSKIGRDVRLEGPSVVGSQCTLGAGAHVAESILWDQTQIGDGAHILRSVIGRNVRIAPHTSISDCIIADNANVKISLSDCQIGPGTVI